MSTVEDIDGEASVDRWAEIEQTTGLKGFRAALGDSDMDPVFALERVNSSLDFMGHGASKWSSQRDKMREMLVRISNGGEDCRVRMLVLDPFDNECSAAAARQTPQDPQHHKRKLITSLLRMEELIEHNNFFVRLYDHPPKFRITIIDGEEVIIGHYRNYLHQVDSGDSAASPLLIFGRGPEWSFANPFRLLFDHEWNKSISVDWDQVRAWDAVNLR